MLDPNPQSLWGALLIIGLGLLYYSNLMPLVKPKAPVEERMVYIAGLTLTLILILVLGAIAS